MAAFAFSKLQSLFRVVNPFTGNIGDILNEQTDGKDSTTDSKAKEFLFKRTVYLAYIDVAAIGSRTLLGINMKKEYLDLNIPELSDLKPVCIRGVTPKAGDKEFSALQVFNCQYTQTDDEFTIVVVNCVVPGSKCHYVGGKIIDLCIKSKVEKMVILTALNIDLADEDNDVFENTFNSAATMTSCPPIPDSTKICDPFLSTVIQMIQVVGLPCNIFSVLSGKVEPGKANMADRTLQKIMSFQNKLSDALHLRFQLELSLSLIYCKNEEDLTSMIYI